MKEVVNELVPDSTGEDGKGSQSIHALHDVFVRKVKMLKQPVGPGDTRGEGGRSGGGPGGDSGAEAGQADGQEPLSPRICSNFRHLTVTNEKAYL